MNKGHALMQKEGDIENLTNYGGLYKRIISTICALFFFIVCRNKVLALARA